MYEREIVWKETLEYFKGDELATNIWIDKYCLKDLNGNLLELTPDDMYKRLAKEFARIEQKYKNPIEYEEIYKLLSSQSILPGGSLLYGIGNDYAISSLGNCFVIGDDADSYGGICTIDQEQVQLMKRRGGVGHDISHLREKGTPTTNAAKTSSGIIPFMERYSNSTREVAQDGRRGALMISCSINHPEVESFITSKDDTSKLTGANISVKIDDKFMWAVESGDKDMYLQKDIWNKLIHQAWKSAEPGVLFWDKITSESPADCYKDFKSTSTNPCGEIPLCPYDSCRLLSVNLYNYIDNPFTSEAKFNFERFKRDVYIAQKLMDDVVDLEEEKIDLILKKIDDDPEAEEIKAIERNLWLKIKAKLLDGRRTGLSGIGLADTLAGLGISYSGGIDFAESIYKVLAIAAYRSSIDMAEDRGAFPIWDKDIEEKNPFLNRVVKAINKTDYGIVHSKRRRNIAILTIPPSGTISLLAKISSGVEPVYQLSYKRRRKVNPDHPNITFVDDNGDCWEEYVVMHPKFETWIKSRSKISVSTENWADINPWKGSTAYGLNPLDRVKMQATIQKWVDHSISSTINLPKEATEEDVSNIYMEAWKLGCKGITIYRDGCRNGVLVSTDDNKEEDDFLPLDGVKRPKKLECDIYYTTAKGIPYNVVVGLYKGRPYEVFATTDIMTTDRSIKGSLIKVKRGHYRVNSNINRDHLMENMSHHERAITRACSMFLRHRTHVKYTIDFLHKTSEDDMYSFNRVIARILKRYVKDKEVITGATCDECGSTDLIYKDGCPQCQSCGNSKCG